MKLEEMTPDTTEGAEIAQKKESRLSFLIGENDTESNGNMEFDRFLREPYSHQLRRKLLGVVEKKSRMLS